MRDKTPNLYVTPVRASRKELDERCIVITTELTPLQGWVRVQDLQPDYHKDREAQRVDPLGDPGDQAMAVDNLATSFTPSRGCGSVRVTNKNTGRQKKFQAAPGSAKETLKFSRS